MNDQTVQALQAAIQEYINILTDSVYKGEHVTLSHADGRQIVLNRFLEPTEKPCNNSKTNPI